MNGKVRWGILSTGRIAHQFARDFEFVPNGELHAVASRTMDSARKFADRHAIPAAYDNYEQMLDDPDVDAVYIATPHTLHCRNAMHAIAARKHVLCEKPFTVGVEESRRVFHVAEQSSVFVMEAMWTYFLPAVRKALEWVQQGRIGRIRQVKADFGYPLLPYDPKRREYDAELGGGCLLEMGIYPVALAWLFLQQDPDEIQVIARRAPNGVEDDVQMLFDYGDNDTGFSATLATSFRSKLQNWAFILGEEAYVAIPDFFRARECRLYHLDDCVDRFEDGRLSLGFNFETAAVGEDILTGRQQNRLMPWGNTIRFQEHMERIREKF
ncbi:MAG: Gfo/Idh/MocA family oxidoreductase [Xanthomonadales bacterium]|nr:Gfo/Idh/MocA family oxidoreductase [Xanthomonadales bacterium]